MIHDHRWDGLHDVGGFAQGWVELGTVGTDVHGELQEAVTPGQLRSQYRAISRAHLEQRPDHEPMERPQALIISPRHGRRELFLFVVHVLPQPETCETETAVIKPSAGDEIVNHKGMRVWDISLTEEAMSRLLCRTFHPSPSRCARYPPG